MFVEEFLQMTGTHDSQQSSGEVGVQLKHRDQVLQVHIYRPTMYKQELKKLRTMSNFVDTHSLNINYIIILRQQLEMRNDLFMKNN